MLYPLPACQCLLSRQSYVYLVDPTSHMDHVFEHCNAASWDNLQFGDLQALLQYSMWTLHARKSPSTRVVVLPNVFSVLLELRCVVSLSCCVEVKRRALFQKGRTMVAHGLGIVGDMLTSLLMQETITAH